MLCFISSVNSDNEFLILELSRLGREFEAEVHPQLYREGEY